MIRIGGVVTRRSGVFPQLQQVKYGCNKCGAILEPFLYNSYSEVKVGSCFECQSKGPFTINIEQVITYHFPNKKMIGNLDNLIFLCFCRQYIGITRNLLSKRTQKLYLPGDYQDIKKLYC